MERLIFFFLCIIISYKNYSQTFSFDDGWRFYLGNTAGAEKRDFKDEAWRLLNVPHDWSIENRSGTQSAFTTESVGGVNTGFTAGGTGWYRKAFTVPASQQGKPVYIQFDGVYMNADVWVNGHHVGNHPYGYTSFYYNIAPYITTGTNTMAVQVKNEGKNSRWYSGSGIYRHVWLRYEQPVHVEHVYITAKLKKANSAVITVETKIKNSNGSLMGLEVNTGISDSKGRGVTYKIDLETKIITDSFYTIKQEIFIPKPDLWSVDAPFLYTATTSLSAAGKQFDDVKTTFGIRTISFSADKGFQLNGKTIKLKGGCVHHDNGPLGAMAFDRAEERKVQLLKASGYNAIRTSHNPPSPYFLDACDRIGMLVIDEAFDTWRDRKNREDYHLYFSNWWQRDIESMITRDRNHPSIIMWSIGNEIPNRDKPEVVKVADSLRTHIHLFDTTRPVTAGVNGVEENKDLFFAALDIAGYNYAPDKYVPDHNRLPNRIMYGTESYPLEAYEYWQQVEAHPWVIGDFVWTAWDYIGEASIGWLGYPQNRNFFPWNLAYCGDIDVCGWKRPQSYYRDVLWKKNQLSVWVKPPQPTFALPTFKQEPWSRWNWQDVQAAWNWPGCEDSLLEVTAYANCDQVELFNNGKSLGKKIVDTASHYKVKWRVPYRAGVLKAVGYSNGKIVNMAMLQTAKEPAQIRLVADRQTLKNNGQDLSYITVTITDATGVIHPDADNLLQFSITGPGKIIAVGNANPTSIESYQTTQRKAWQGRCLIIVQSSNKVGKIVVMAKGEGLKGSSVGIENGK